jgi:hypothetical protein
VEVRSIINGFKLCLGKIICNKTKYNTSIVFNFSVSGFGRIVC